MGWEESRKSTLREEAKHIAWRLTDETNGTGMQPEKNSQVIRDARRGALQNEVPWKAQTSEDR